MLVSCIEKNLERSGVHVDQVLQYDMDGVFFVKKHSSKQANNRLICDEPVEEIRLDRDILHKFYLCFGDKIADFFDACDLLVTGGYDFYELLEKCLLDTMTCYRCFIGCRMEWVEPVYIYIIGEPEADAIEKAIKEIREEWRANNI